MSVRTIVRAGVVGRSAVVACAFFVAGCAASESTPVVNVPPEPGGAPLAPLSPVAQPKPLGAARIARLTPEEMAAIGFARLRGRALLAVEVQQLLALMRATPYPSPDRPKIQARIASDTLEFAFATARDPGLSPKEAEKLVANTTAGTIRFTKSAEAAAGLSCTDLVPGCHQQSSWVVGLALWASGKPAEAAVVLRDEVVNAMGELNPSPLLASRALVVLGLMAEDEGRASEAVKLFAQAAQRAPQTPAIRAVVSAHGAAMPDP